MQQGIVCDDAMYSKHTNYSRDYFFLIFFNIFVIITNTVSSMTLSVNTDNWYE